MGWNDSGDLKTIFLQGVIPLVLGLGLCFLGALYLFGILTFSCKRHDDQVAPVMMVESEGADSGIPMARAAAEKAYGRVACEAQLFGMQPKERHAVVEAIFSDCVTHKEGETAWNEDGLRMTGPQELDTRCACSICLREYEDSEEVTTGTACNHMFHKNCAMVWLTKKDHCPYCREEMMTAAEMKRAALEVLGEERVKELSHFPAPLNASTAVDNTRNDEAPTDTVTNLGVPDIENIVHDER